LILAGGLTACQLEDPQVGLRTAEVLTLTVGDSVLLAEIGRAHV